MNEAVRDLVLLAAGAFGNLLAVWAVLRPAVHELRRETHELREEVRALRRHAGLPSTFGAPL